MLKFEQEAEQHSDTCLQTDQSEVERGGEGGWKEVKISKSLNIGER